MIRRLIILLLIFGCVFAQNSNIDTTFYFYKEFGDNSTDTTLLNVNEFVTPFRDKYFVAAACALFTLTKSAFAIPVLKTKSTANKILYIFFIINSFG